MAIPKPHPPSGHEVRHATSSADRIVEGIEELSTVSEVASTIELGQDLVNQESHPSDGGRGREQTMWS